MVLGKQSKEIQFLTKHSPSLRYNLCRQIFNWLSILQANQVNHKPRKTSLKLKLFGAWNPKRWNAAIPFPLSFWQFVKHHSFVNSTSDWAIHFLRAEIHVAGLCSKCLIPTCSISNQLVAMSECSLTDSSKPRMLSRNACSYFYTGYLASPLL